MAVLQPRHMLLAGVAAVANADDTSIDRLKSAARPGRPRSSSESETSSRVQKMGHISIAKQKRSVRLSS